MRRTEGHLHGTVLESGLNLEAFVSLLIAGCVGLWIRSILCLHLKLIAVQRHLAQYGEARRPTKAVNLRRMWKFGP